MTEKDKAALEPIRTIYAGMATKGALGICESGEWKDWIFWKHPDGQWVSLCKLSERSAPSPAAGFAPEGWKLVPIDPTGYMLLKGSYQFNETPIEMGTSVMSNRIYKKYRDWETDRKSTRLNSSHSAKSRMPSSA